MYIFAAGWSERWTAESPQGRTETIGREASRSDPRVWTSDFAVAGEHRGTTNGPADGKRQRIVAMDARDECQKEP
jgi:hypothetical protein